MASGVDELLLGSDRNKGQQGAEVTSTAGMMFESSGDLYYERVWAFR